MSRWSYAVACVVIPSVWAVVVFYVLGWIEARRAAAPVAPVAIARRDDDVPPADYMI